MVNQLEFYLSGGQLLGWGFLLLPFFETFTIVFKTELTASGSILEFVLLEYFSFPCYFNSMNQSLQELTISVSLLITLSFVID